MDAIDPAELRQLVTVRQGLLRLHKALLDGQRRQYERENGQVASAGAFLQLAIADPAFEWLHRFSELVVEIDEATDSGEPLTPAIASALLEQARRLVNSDEAKQRSNADASTIRNELKSLLE
jgi:hypothetical protein